MQIEILGSGCKSCQTLEARARDALAELGLDAELAEVTDVGEIAARGVMRTPALVVDGDVVVAGRVPAVRELRELLAARVAIDRRTA